MNSTSSKFIKSVCMHACIVMYSMYTKYAMLQAQTERCGGTRTCVWPHKVSPNSKSKRIYFLWTMASILMIPVGFGKLLLSFLLFSHISILNRETSC